METATMLLVGAVSAVFIIAAVYLHVMRKRSEGAMPAPFLNPAGKRKPKKK